ncbi:hypothetical protein C2E23DRAFT_885579 [Lenzites betulinus]|nr:hypothetical protein C2E23DRAFT_885579 [Lenzites betulinus]
MALEQPSTGDFHSDANNPHDEEADRPMPLPASVAGEVPVDNDDDVINEVDVDSEEEADVDSEEEADVDSEEEADEDEEEAGLAITDPLVLNRRLLHRSQTRVYLSHEMWHEESASTPPGRYFVAVVGIDDEGNGMSSQIFFPLTLAAARNEGFATWNIAVEGVRRKFRGLLKRSHAYAIKTIAYIFLWFSYARADDTRDVQALWDQLHQLIASLAMMGMLQRTEGERLIYNLRQWARHEIEDALPAYLRHATTGIWAVAGADGGPAETPELFWWDRPV